MWVLTWLALAGAQLGSSVVATGPLGTELALFWVVVVAAGLCVLTSAVVLLLAFREDTAELALHGAFFMAVSLLPLVHGMTTPGVLYGPNNATTSSVLWGLPLACLAQLPLVLRGRVGSAVAQRWRGWVLGNLALHALLAIALLVRPSFLPAGGMGARLSIVVAVAALGLSAVMSARHLRLYWVSRQPSTLVVSLAYASVGTAHLIWVNGAPMTAGFWLAHALDIAGVFLGTIVAARAYRRNALERTVLRPLTDQDPLRALELGLDPVVKAFLADLADKDEITHDHVIRTAEIAMCVGERLQLPAHDLRHLGLGALLHDLGKLEVPDEILNKPGRLTDEEFDVIKRHTIEGERLVSGSRVLVPLAPLVRHHHERLDGRGYPDGLAGHAIPQLARIISVCDAYDAMVHSRQYRDGMGSDKAVAILREHSGAQWDPEVVDTLVSLVAEGQIPAALRVLATARHQIGCSCTLELPTPV